MPRFSFRAVGFDGERINGEIEAADQNAVVKQLRRQQQMPVSIELIDPANTSTARYRHLLDWLNSPILSSKRLKSRELAVMTREFAMLLDAGLTVDQSLNFLADVTTSKTQRKVLNALLTRVQGGSSIADALDAQSETFSPTYISLVRAGEVGNSLDTVLAQLADYLGRVEVLNHRIKTALIYPTLLMVMASISVVILMTVVLPQFTPIFEGAGKELPWLTKIVVAAGKFLELYWWLLFFVMAIIGLWLNARLRHPASRAIIDRAILKLPLFGDLVVKVDTARFARTVSTLLSNGVSLPNALSIAKDALSNVALRETISEAILSIKEGQSLADLIRQSGRFPPLAVHLIAVGERSGSLEATLEKIDEIFDQEVTQLIDRLMTLLVPALTIAVGLVIATIIGAILSAILAAYQLPV